MENKDFSFWEKRGKAGVTEREGKGGAAESRLEAIFWR